MKEELKKKLARRSKKTISDYARNYKKATTTKKATCWLAVQWQEDMKGRRNSHVYIVENFANYVPDTANSLTLTHT